MDEIASHVFRSQPPLVSLGGYKSPRLVVKPIAKSLKPSNIEEDTYLYPLQSILVGKTDGSAPIGIVPEGIGKSQKLPMLPQLLNELKSAPGKRVQKQERMSESIVKSSLKEGDVLNPGSVILPPSTLPNSRSFTHPSGYLFSRPTSAVSTSKRPYSAIQSARTVKTVFTRSGSGSKRKSETELSSPPLSQRLAECALQSSKLTWDISHKVMKFERGREKGVVTVEGETKTMSLEEPIKEVEPVPVKIVKYKGDYRAGKRDGHGWAEFENGDTYDGDWVQDIRQGRGIYTYKAFGAVYSGDVFQNMKHGRGHLTLRNGDQIFGEFVKNSMIDSHVTIDYFPTGHYDGLMKEGKKHGTGSMEYAEHQDYQGEWVEDRRTGLGYIKFQGGFFEGNFIRDNVDGKGVLLYLNVLPLSRPSTDRTPDPTPPVKTKKKTIAPDLRITQISQIAKMPAKAAVLIPHYAVAKIRVFGEDLDFFHFSSYHMRDCDVIWKSLKAKELTKRLGWEEEEVVDGKFYRGELNGAGMVRYGGYALYEGVFKNSKKHGYGRMTYTDIEHMVTWLPESEGKYEGRWENDMRHGKGTMVFPNGLKYEGNFRCDNRHNVVGTMTFRNGNMYVGNWVENMMQGKGQYRTVEGRVYEGNFVRGMFGSEGRLLFSTGEYYEGEVSRMNPHGKGRIKYTDGSSYEGQFDMGVRMGSGIMHYSNGDKYEGDWEQGQRDGYGKMSYFGRGERYEGFWSEDMRNGKGTLYGKHGVFVGLWHNDVKEGEGEADHQMNI